MKKFIALSIMVLLTIAATAQQKRVALIIGNAAYQHGGALKNPVNDAKLMAQTLRELGFEVTLKTDASLAVMQDAAVNFTGNIKNYDVALFYYAGHGVQVNGTNFLIPVNAKMDTELRTKYEAFDISDINYAFAQNNGNMNIMILDACRDNPFRSWARGGARGFKAVGNQAAGTIIAFATREGETASDGTGSNGLYTQELVKQLKTGEDINTVFKNTRIAVLAASQNAQCPQEWDMTTGKFYFAGSSGNTTPPVEHKTEDNTAATGSIQLYSDYADKFYVDGVFYKQLTAGSTSTYNNVPAGVRVLSIGNAPVWTEKVMVFANQTTAVRAEKQAPKNGTLKLNAQNLSGTLYIDDVSYGYLSTGDTKTYDLPPGTYTLRINSAPEWTSSFTITAGSTSYLTAEKKPDNTVTEGFVLIKGGTFTMGSPASEVNRSDDETQHSVTLSDFYMGKYEVTQKEWRDIMGSNPSNFSGCDNCPVEMVSWDDVQTYIQKLNAKTGLKYRLPTEAEWEYAAGGGASGRTKWAGTDSESSLSSYAWYTANSGSKTHPVGQKSPNKLGLYDLSGNVWEWCSDWYGTYPTGVQTNPQGATGGANRVLRGGSWSSIPDYCRVANRNNYYPTDRHSSLGFRLGRSL